MQKRSSTQMSFEITPTETRQAEKALIAFNRVKKSLRSAVDHLDIMYNPFKDNPDISEDQILKFRAALRDYRDRVVDNFNKFKVEAFRCVSLMQIFSSDTQTFKLIKSFISSIDDLEDNVNHFAELFDDLKSSSFVKDIVAVIDDIKKSSDEIEDVIDDRINNHIQTNILGRTWVDGISNELKVKIEKQKPILVDLFQQRQDQLVGKHRE
jgi:hypothetical protein